MRIDAAIQSERVLAPEGLRKAVVLISGGTIAGVVPELPGGDVPLTDAGNLVVMPGIVDPHVHINEPGRTDWEGFDTATRAALAGGITTLVDMPLNSSPVTTTVKGLEEKLKAIGGQTGTVRPLHTNCGFWGGIIPGNEMEIEPLIKNGVLGFKAFLAPSGIDEFPPVREATLRSAMPLIARHGLPLLVHAELVDTKAGSMPDPRSYRQYLASRPPAWEDNAIALMIRLCEEFNCRTHIVHLSSAGSLEQIRRARQKGLPLTVETAPHYLYFSAENIPDGRTEFKCAPPIRERVNNRQLWEGLREGLIDFVATDHSPAPPALKETGSGNLEKAWGGIASLQLSLPVMWTAARARGFGIEAIGNWLCARPAALPGLQQRKGKIEKGFDADLVIWNPGKSFRVSENLLQHRHKLTPYTGEELYGTVEQTWLGGEKVFEGGKFLHLNRGEWIREAKSFEP